MVNTSIVPDVFYNRDENFVKRWERGLANKGKENFDKNVNDK